MSALLCQKTSRKSKFKEKILNLKCSKEHWKSGDLRELLKEGTAVQSKLRLMSNKVRDENLAPSFAKLIKKGKITSAMRLLSGEKAVVQQLDGLTEEKKVVKNGYHYTVKLSVH